MGHDFQDSLPHLFPQRISEGSAEEQEDEVPDLPQKEHWEKAHRVPARDNGYLQRLDNDRLLVLACENDLILKLLKRPGDFAAEEVTLLLVLPPSKFHDKLEHDLRDCFSQGAHRTPHQDAEYSLQQLVEIASRALSPGVNEPFTAITCIDWLGASLRGVASRDIPSPYRRDDNGKLRVIAPPLSFDRLAHSAFDTIRVYGVSNPDVTAHLLQTIADIAPQLHREGDRKALQRHARAIGRDAARIKNAEDRQRVENQLQKTLRALAQL